MNIIFLTLVQITDLAERGNIYADLLREFSLRGDKVYVVSPAEKRMDENTHLIEGEYGTVLRVRTGNIQKTGIIEKGFSTLALEGQYLRAIREHLNGVRFDLVLYSTPPITLVGVVEYLKKRDGAASYLLLKDIFPQNAVDLGMMSTAGPKSVIYRYFRRQEKRLYRFSDHIGCMSPANVEYLLRQDPWIDPAKVEVCPNSVDEVCVHVLSEAEKREVRRVYGIPEGRTVFMYGGNFGRPQDVPFICRCLRACSQMEDAYFVLCGNGTDYGILKSFFDDEKPGNALLINGLPRAEYESLTAACDVGLIFLDHRFTIPNFPSRLLSYLQGGLPVVCCTDRSTDMGRIAEAGGFGWQCESLDPNDFAALIRKACAALAGGEGEAMNRHACEYLLAHYTAGEGCRIIRESLQR